MMFFEGTYMTQRRDEPAELLRKLVSQARTPLNGAFELAPPEAQTTTREKGLYGFFYGKAIQRLATALSLDREVLILLSTFEEQQQRIIKVAKDLIASSNGRLDPMLAVIFHQDPDGDTKLPKWGRNVGLVVLPIYSGTMPVDALSLQRHLCHELFSHDPFDVTGPVTDDEQFYGRRNEALNLARKLQTGQIISCLGIRKIGKTSVMNRVINEAKTHHDCHCISMDCSRDEIWEQDAESLMSSLSNAIRLCVANNVRYETVSSGSESRSLAASTASLLQAIRSTSKPVIIFIDEVDYITPGSPTSALWREEFNRFWRNFRSVYQEALRSNHRLSVMVSGVSAKWFSVETINSIENAALSFIPEEYLPPLARKAGKEMIKKIAKTAGMIVSDEAAEAIAAATSDMPFWIRKACSFIHRSIEIDGRPLAVGVELVEDLLLGFLQSEGGTLGQVAVSHLFRVYPELREPCLCVLEERSDSVTLAKITVLRNYGLLATNKPVRLSGPMIKTALVAFQEQQAREAEDPREVQEARLPSSALQDWAEELAVVSKERNLLEKRLRTFVLNFIRADGLQQKKRGGARDRVLDSLTTERRSRFSNLSADDLMEHLYWSELQVIVQREWAVFATVFGDRKQFDKHYDITNDRPDTHAKDADGLDIALQRRSLKWLSDRLNSV